MDAATLLVARTIPSQGIREGGVADVAGNARPGVHTAADRPLHPYSGRSDTAAIRDPHERLSIPERGRGVGRRVRRLRGRVAQALQRRARATHIPLLHLLPRGVVFGPLARPLLAVKRLLQVLAAALFVLSVAGCGSPTPKFQGSDVTGVDFGRDFKLIDHTGKPRTLAD